MPEQDRAMSAEDARRRLNALRAKEVRGELTVREAGEITKLLVRLGEKQGGQKAAKDWSDLNPIGRPRKS